MYKIKSSSYTSICDKDPEARRDIESYSFCFFFYGKTSLRFKQRKSTYKASRFVQTHFYLLADEKFDPSKRLINFVSTFKKYGGNEVYGYVRSTFLKLALPLSRIEAVKGYAQYDQEKHVIEFTIYLEKNISVTIAKPLDHLDDNDVMFSLAESRETEMVNVADFNELLKALRDYTKKDGNKRISRRYITPESLSSENRYIPIAEKRKEYICV